MAGGGVGRIVDGAAVGLTIDNGGRVGAPVLARGVGALVVSDVTLRLARYGEHIGRNIKSNHIFSKKFAIERVCFMVDSLGILESNKLLLPLQINIVKSIVRPINFIEAIV